MTDQKQVIARPRECAAAQLTQNITLSSEPALLQYKAPGVFWPSCECVRQSGERRCQAGSCGDLATAPPAHPGPRRRAGSGNSGPGAGLGAAPALLWRGGRAGSQTGLKSEVTLLDSHAQGRTRGSSRGTRLPAGVRTGRSGSTRARQPPRAPAQKHSSTCLPAALATAQGIFLTRVPHADKLLCSFSGFTSAPHREPPSSHGRGAAASPPQYGHRPLTLRPAFQPSQWQDRGWHRPRPQDQWEMGEVGVSPSIGRGGGGGEGDGVGRREHGGGSDEAGLAAPGAVAGEAGGAGRPQPFPSPSRGSPRPAAGPGKTSPRSHPRLRRGRRRPPHPPHPCGATGVTPGWS